MNGSARTPSTSLGDVPRAWSVIVLACALYAASMVDRFIPSLLITGLSRDLHISPVQFGLLLGTSFGLLFATVAFPIAYVVDRHNRATVVAVGALLWSLATIACGFVESFTQILIARAGVAMGEAVLMPATMSLIGDLFPGGRRTRPTAVFSGTGMVMGTGLFLVGSAAVMLAAIAAPALGLAEWRVTFLIVGLPPLLIGVTWLAIVREPARRSRLSMGDSAPPETAVRYLLDHRAVFFPLFVVTAMGSTMSFSLLGWLPAIFMRAHGMSPAATAAWMGTAGVLPCLLGASAAPALSVFAQRRGLEAGVLGVSALFFVVSATALALTVTAASAGVVLAGFALTTFGLAGCNVLPMIIIQWIVPTQICGRFTAIIHLATSLGLAVGPPAVAVVATHFLGDARAPASSLAAVVIAAAAIGLGAIAICASPFARHHRLTIGLRGGYALAPNKRLEPSTLAGGLA